MTDNSDNELVTRGILRFELGEIRADISDMKAELKEHSAQFSKYVTKDEFYAAMTAMTNLIMTSVQELRQEMQAMRKDIMGVFEKYITESEDDKAKLDSRVIRLERRVL